GRLVLQCLHSLFVVMYYFSFFFSSRRRHTRSKRDWSSDVCSSDLSWPRPSPPSRRRCRWERRSASSCRLLPRLGRRHLAEDPARSEERRVGKECKARRAPEQ